MRFLEAVLTALIPSPGRVTVKKFSHEQKDRLAFFQRERDGQAAVAYREDALEGTQWEEPTFHEAGHGIFDREFQDQQISPKSPLFGLAQDLSDARHLKGVSRFYPYAMTDVLSEQELMLRHFVRQGNLAEIAEWLRGRYASGTPTLKQIFQMILTTYVKLHTHSTSTDEDQPLYREQLEKLADLLDRMTDLTADLFPVNPFRLALPHLDLAQAIVDCIPDTLEEEAVKFQSYRAAAN